MSLQGKLLRPCRSASSSGWRRYHPTVDVRVIAATNKDLEKAVDAGEFREDLYYRLSVFPVQVPPLRRRGDDVVQLAVHFLEQVCREFGRPVLQLTQTQVDALGRYDWPGNVRELKNVIERAVILSRGESLRLDLSLSEAGAGNGVEIPSLAPTTPSAGASGPEILTEAAMKARQRANIVAALAAAGGRIAGKGGAAELLGIRPTTLNDRIRSLKIPRRPRS